MVQYVLSLWIDVPTLYIKILVCKARNLKNLFVSEFSSLSVFIPTVLVIIKEWKCCQFFANKPSYKMSD